MAFAFFYAIWGTSWTFPIIDINYSYLWLGTAILGIFFSNSVKINIEVFLVPLLIAVCVIFYFFIGIPDALSSDKGDDFYYLLIYVIKIFIGLFLIFCFLNLFKSEEDLVLFFKTIALTIIPIVIYLAYKYLYVYGVDFIGVEVDDGKGATKTFKNSLATSIALISPFIFAGLYGNKNKLIYFLAFLSILFFLYYVNSRSSIIIFAIEILFFLFLSQSKRLKRNLRYIFLVLFGVVIFSGISFTDWILKNNQFSDSGLPTFFQAEADDESLLESRRGWLLIQALDGYISSNLVGNGIATFRIRPSNFGSRSETHNDYALLLYEQGTIGFILFFYLIIWRISINNSLLKKHSNRFLEASSSSLLGLLVALVFINLIQTLVFWTIISISFVFSQIYKK